MPFVPFVPFGEYQPDAPTIAPGVVRRLKNAYWHNNAYRPFPAAAAAAYPDLPSGVANRPLKSLIVDGIGQRVFVVGTPTGIYEYANRQWTDISPAAGFSGTTIQDWWLLPWGNGLLAANGISRALLVGTLGLGTRLNVASATAPVGKYLAELNNYVFCAGLTGDEGNKILISPQERPDGDWDSLGADSIILQEGGDIVGMAGQDVIFVFQRRSVWQVSPAGAEIRFAVDKIDTGEGLLSSGSIAQVDDRVYYLSDGGFRVLGTGGQIGRIGYRRVDDYALSALTSTAQAEAVRSVVDHERKVIIWSIPSDSTNPTNLNRHLVYNYADDRWGQGERPCMHISKIASSALSVDDEVVGALSVDSAAAAARVGNIDASEHKGGVESLICFSPNDDGDAISVADMSAGSSDTEIETGFFDIADALQAMDSVPRAARVGIGGRAYVSGARVWADIAADDQIDMCLTAIDYPGQPTRSCRRMTRKPSGFFGVEIEGRIMAVSVSLNGDDWTEAQGFTLDVKPGSKI